MSSSKELYRMISEGEHQRQDFKYEIDDARKIAKSIVAFANTDGGRLLIGVKDNGNIKGVHSEEEIHMAEAAAEMYSEPEVKFKVRHWEADGKNVLEIYIPKSNSGPHFVKNKDGPKKAYVRKNDQNLAVNTVILKYWELKKGAMKGKKFDYGENETKLFEYLKEHRKITFSKYCRLTEMHFEKAAERLAKLLHWEVIDLDLSEKGCFYYLKEE